MSAASPSRHLAPPPPPHGLTPQVLQHAHAALVAKFGESAGGAVGALVFLRFLCPAICHPDAYGVLESPSPPDRMRGLVLLSKTIQNLANGVMFGLKEEFMMPLNEFIALQRDDLTAFASRLLNDSTYARPSSPPTPPAPPGSEGKVVGALIQIAILAEEYARNFPEDVQEAVAAALHALPSAPVTRRLSRQGDGGGGGGEGEVSAHLRSKLYQSLGVPLGEKFLGVFGCYVERSVTIHGTLFVSAQYFCFFGTLLG